MLWKIYSIAHNAVAAEVGKGEAVRKRAQTWSRSSTNITIFIRIYQKWAENSTSEEGCPSSLALEVLPWSYFSMRSAYP
jgi:hypothetical protein